jgi:hypothetical protein
MKFVHAMEADDIPNKRPELGFEQDPNVQCLKHQNDQASQTVQPMEIGWGWMGKMTDLKV